MLKVTNLISSLIFCFLIIACGGDGDEQLENESIQGTWVAESLVGMAESSITFQGQDFQTSFSFEDISLDYEVTFDETSFSTKGDYNIKVIASANGEVIADTNSEVSDVSGSGKYTDSGTSITFDKSFFNLTYEGEELGVMGVEQSADYEINDKGELIISQNETTESTEFGTSVSQIISTSVWKRK